MKNKNLYLKTTMELCQKKQKSLFQILNEKWKKLTHYLKIIN